MFKSKQKGFYSTIFDNGIYNFFSNRNFAVDRIDNSIFFKIKEIFPFVNAVVIPKQVHSSKIGIVGKKLILNKSFFRIEAVDGVITSLSKVALGILTADCVPVLLSDGYFVAAYHAGWKGSLENIASKIVDVLKEKGVRVEKIKVALGPSIGECCYFIDKKRIELFSKKYSEWEFEIFSKKNSKVYLNLLKLNYLQLVKRGVKKENIDFFPFCTSCDARFFSFRREGKVEKEMISLIAKE